MVAYVHRGVRRVIKVETPLFHNGCDGRQSRVLSTVGNSLSEYCLPPLPPLRACTAVRLALTNRRLAL